MKKQIFILTHDYWHHSDSIEPMVKQLFDGKADVNVVCTTDPKEFRKFTPDLFISFKDPIENDQIPTPVWCDEEWTQDFLKKTQDGMGVLGIHAFLTDLPEGHGMLEKMIRSRFLSHPAPCEVSFVPVAEHPILEGVGPFVFPCPEEHYAMEFLERAQTMLLANTESVNGVQPGMWVHEYGSGRICCITPAHTTESLIFPPFLKLVRNAANWCLKSDVII